MDENHSFIESSLTEEDHNYEVPLRPQSLGEFLGQEEIKERLDVFLGAAKKRRETLGHCLLSGPPGLGKTTLANIIAKTMGSSLVVTSGPMLDKPADLAGILTNLQEGDVLFIDEIHRMQRTVEEYLYPAMEDYVLDLMIDSGPNARSVQVKLNTFTLVGATTRSGLMTAPMRSRFAFTCRLDYYSPEVLERILARSGNLLNLDIDDESLFEISKRARGTPRIANNLLRWVRDYAQMRAGNRVNKGVVDKALDLLSIDAQGLDEMDKKILTVLIDHYGGGPVGLNTIAIAIGEEGHTVEEVYEPFLILQGLLKRTPRGRVATDRAYHHLGKKKEIKMRALLVCGLLMAVPLGAVSVHGPKQNLQSLPEGPKIKVLLEENANSAFLEVRGSYRVVRKDSGSLLSYGNSGKRFMVHALQYGLRWGEEYPDVYQISVVPTHRDTLVSVNGIQYKGAVSIYHVHNNKITIVNEVPIEDYLRSTLALQYDAPLHREALSALVIAARTKAYSQAIHGKSTSRPWEITAHEVGYYGHGVTQQKNGVEEAVDWTRFMVMESPKYGGVSQNISLGPLKAQELAQMGLDATKILYSSFPNQKLGITIDADEIALR